MPKSMTIDLDAADMIALDGTGRAIEILRRLHAEGFEFEEVDDLPPDAAISLRQPYALDVRGAKVTYTQM